MSLKFNADDDSSFATLDTIKIFQSSYIHICINVLSSAYWVLNTRKVRMGNRKNPPNVTAWRGVGGFAQTAATDSGS